MYKKSAIQFTFPILECLDFQTEITLTYAQYGFEINCNETIF